MLILTALIGSFLCCIYVVPTATAETKPTYVRVIDNSTPLYTNADTRKTTCLLHKSYYLMVVSATLDLYQVTIFSDTADFPTISGYVKKDDVLLVDYIPTNPLYPAISLTVTATSANIHFSPKQSSTVEMSAVATQTLKYYGSIVDDGSIWHYVYIAGTHGYILSSKTTSPNVPLHPTPLETDANTTPTDPDTDGSGGTTPTNPVVSTSEILLIIFVILLSIGLVLVLLVPQRKKQKNNE